MRFSVRIVSPSDPDSSAPFADDRLNVVLSRLGLTDPLRWLALGWRDFRRCPLIGAFYGACFMVMGWALLWVYKTNPAYVMGLSAGFLLVSPFLCLGLYRVSQRLERGEKPRFVDSLLAFRARAGTLGLFGLVLLVLELLWSRATLVIFALSFDGMPDLQGSLLALLNRDNIAFTLAWLGVGAIFAGLIYSVSAVSIPMILDRQTDAITAGLASLRLVLSQTPVMLFWGALITALVVLALLPWFAGLPVVAPVLGYASWHAYRSAISFEPAAVAAAAPRATG